MAMGSVDFHEATGELFVRVQLMTSVKIYSVMSMHQHNNHCQQYCVTNFKVLKRLDHNCSTHKEDDNYVT